MAQVSHPAAPASKAPLVQCAIKKVVIYTTGKVWVRGYCRQNGRPVAALPHYSYTTWDTDGYTGGYCAPASGTAQHARFVVAPAGIKKAVAVAREVPKNATHFISKPKKFVVVLKGNPNLQCGTTESVKLPGPGALCNQAQWPPNRGWPTQWVSYCSQPPKDGCAFASTTFPYDPVTGRVSVPHVICPVAVQPCAYVRGDGNPNDSGPMNDGMGGVSYVWHLACKNGMGADVTMILEGWNANGVSCPWMGSGARTVVLNPSKAGTLYIAASIVSWGKYGVFNSRIGVEVATTAITLQPQGTPTDLCG